MFDGELPRDKGAPLDAHGNRDPLETTQTRARQDSLTARIASGRTSAHVIAAIVAPIPTTVLLVSGHLQAGLILMTCVSITLSLLRMRSAFSEKATTKFPLAIDAILLLLIALMSVLTLALLASPGESKLHRLGLAGFTGATETIPSYLAITWSLSLATLPVGRRSALHPTDQIFFPPAAFVMGTVGVVGLALSLTVSRYDAFLRRGEDSGNGIASLLYWCAAAFVAYTLVLWTRKDSRIAPVASVLMILGIILAGNRSPLALIGIAFLVRLTIIGRQRHLTLFASLVPVGIVVFSYQSAWRSMVSRGVPSAPFDVLRSLASDPLTAFLRVGFDTIDGYSLSRRIIASGYEARWTDPLLAVTNFIPRRLWPEKPSLLGSEIGEQYLGLSAGGIFLSGPGYFGLVTGSLFLGAMAFIALILLAKWVTGRPSTHLLIVAAIVYMVTRVSVGGDAFDIFLSLQIVAILAASTLIGKALPWSR